MSPRAKRSDGGKVNTQNSEKLTPLHLASTSHSIDAIALLVKLGADVSARNKAGETPIFGRVFIDAPEVIAEFAKLGVDPNACDIDGQTPLDLAEREKAEKSAAMLRELGGKRGAEL